MPRKKVVKSAARKSQPSKQASKPVNTLQKLETEFSAAPAKLAEQIKKEIAALKQQEAKLNVTLNKIQGQAVKIEKAIAATQKLSTAAGRKQLAAAKKALNDTKKDLALSNTALKANANAIIDAEIKLARYTELAKLLKKFAKDFAAQAKKLKDKAVAAEKAKAAAKAKPGKTKATKTKTTKAKPKAKVKAKSKSTAETASPVLTVVDQADFNSYNHTTDEESQLDDVKQAIS
jgi:DNA-binding FrmR family transcriptional regulator